MLYRILSDLGINHTPQYVLPYSDTFMVLDCFIPEHNIDIELDGFYHIMSPTKCAEDCARDETRQLAKIEGLKETGSYTVYPKIAGG